MFSVVNSLPHQLGKRNDWATCHTSAGTFPRLGVSTTNNGIVEGQQTTFTVSGSSGFIQSDIETSDGLYIIFIDDDNEKNVHTFSTLVCGQNGLPSCPIKAGTPFTVYISVAVPQFPDAFDVYAVIGNPPDRTLGCAYTNEWP
ncbi:18808_t:CDS:1 [Gigaspora margarita]|uniref:18808_t:CDS:1 n=1 Tax=Gigaspora margarita TaxID=4874 RepID=A0ABN7VGP3_GIGMA|nr:18808_t:CDS:1 [Gigaspora margarita]